MPERTHLGRTSMTAEERKRYEAALEEHQLQTTSPPTVGSGKFQYRPIPQWETIPKDWSFIDVAGVAVDSQNRLFVFNRGAHPLVVFDRDGNLVDSWDERHFTRPHGIHIGPDDMVYITDDEDHTVRKYSPKGELLMTLGDGRPSATGMRDFDYRQITHGGDPFNYPTNIALAPNGSIYVADGYGNARVHKFSSEGELQLSWGGPGDGHGEFNLPHGIALDSKGLVYVADRENSRIQIFSPEGQFINQWTHVSRPMQVFIDPDDNVFVAEVGRKAGLFPWMESGPNPTGGRLSVLTTDGEVIARWGNGDNPGTPGDFFAPHDICVDSEGSIYVGEVVWSAGVQDEISGNPLNIVPPNCPTLHKYVRI